MVPTIVVAEMLGVPEDRHGDFRRWSTPLSATWPGAMKTSRPGRRCSPRRGAQRVLREEIERHRVEQPDDLLTAVIRASGDGGVMSDDEVRAAAVLLLAAGYDTTAKLLSNALLAFEENRGQRALLVAGPALMPGRDRRSAALAQHGPDDPADRRERPDPRGRRGKGGRDGLHDHRCRQPRPVPLG